MRRSWVELAVRLGIAATVSYCATACDDGDGDGNKSDASSDFNDAFVSDSTVGADAQPMTDGGETRDGTAADAGVGIPVCPPDTNYGLTGVPIVVAEGETANHSARAVWTGNEWGVIWLADGADGESGEVKFRRVGRDGALIGEPTVVGGANAPKFGLVYTGTGYVVAWRASRNETSGFEGVRVATLGADGTLVADPVDLEDTFDVDRVTLGWARLQGGMLAYTRGRGGADGLYTAPIDEAGQPMRANLIFAEKSQSPAVAFGNGNWGVSWLSPGAESNSPNDLLFQLIDIDGQPEGAAPARQEDAAAQGNVFISYGLDFYGVGWSADDGSGQLRTRLALYDSSGQLSLNPPVPGPTGFALVTDVGWMDPQFFGVAWQDTIGTQRVIGLTRVNVHGQPEIPYAFPIPESMTGQSLSVAGNTSLLGAFFTVDPAPQPAGLSAGTRIELGLVGQCTR